MLQFVQAAQGFVAINRDSSLAARPNPPLILPGVNGITAAARGPVTTWWNLM